MLQQLCVEITRVYGRRRHFLAKRNLVVLTRRRAF